jgi:hypothetical protein
MRHLWTLLSGIAAAAAVMAVSRGRRWRAWPKQVDALVDNGSVAYAAANVGTTEQFWVQSR